MQEKSKAATPAGALSVEHQEIAVIDDLLNFMIVSHEEALLLQA